MTRRGWWIGTVLFMAAPALAQPAEEPVGRYVVDARASLVPFGRNVELTRLRGLLPVVEPSRRGIGFDVGAHVYVFRLGWVTFGVGGSYHHAVTVRKRLTALSPQLSFNFGGRDGWSYLSGGLGVSRLSLASDELSQRMTKTLNYGGGARWFTSDHLAFSIELRFYAMSPLLNEQPRMTQMALNVGVSFK